MTQHVHGPERTTGVCKPLVDACTLSIYKNNAFRITGLFADASVRDVKRRIDDLKNNLDMDGTELLHTHAFGLDPPPALDRIREAASKLQDPERRIVEEFFWFWPLEWGSGDKDPALKALAGGDKTTPFQLWKKGLSCKHSQESSVCKHNLAVMYHMSALDGELISLHQNLNENSLATLEKYWRASFACWEALSDSESFWSLVSARIRMLDDPRLTTGFARRMRATLPEALDNINALLAQRYFENGNHALGRKHIVFMRETHQGLDNVSRTLSTVAKPIKHQIRHAIDKAHELAANSPSGAAQAAEDLLRTIRKPLALIRELLPPDDDDRIDLCDAVAEAGLACTNAFIRQRRDFERCLAILKDALESAESEQCRKKITETLALAEEAALLEPVLRACEAAATAAENHPEKALLAASELLTKAKSWELSLENPDDSSKIKERAHHRIAENAVQCAIAYGNRTKDWKSCVALLETSLGLASDGSLRSYIVENLQIARQNAEHKSLFETCWFCRINEANDAANLHVQMHGDVQRNWVFGGTRVTFRKLEICVPRCLRCKAAHTNTKTVGCLGIIAGAIIGSIPFPFLGTIIGALAGWGIGALIGIAVRPHGVSPEGIKADYPPIKEMLTQGWQLGEKPS